MENEVRERLINARSIGDLPVTDCDLSNENLGGLSANGAKFTAVDLCRANLRGIRWRNCTLSRVRLDEADLSSMVMRLCTFKQVSAVRGRFAAGRMENCQAQACDFSHADFSGASLTDSDFNRSSFEGASLTGADAGYCNLRGVDFRSAILVNTSFRDADLRGADFSGAVIENTDFRGADLRGTQFDPELEAQGLAQQERPQPPVDLVSAVAPLVAGLLKQAGNRGVIDETAWQAELDAALREFGAGPLNGQGAGVWDEEIGKWLHRAGELGVDRLLETLRSDSEEAPREVAGMLEGLGRDLGLKPDATTEQLLSALIARLRGPRQ